MSSHILMQVNKHFLFTLNAMYTADGSLSFEHGTAIKVLTFYWDGEQPCQIKNLKMVSYPTGCNIHVELRSPVCGQHTSYSEES